MRLKDVQSVIDDYRTQEGGHMVQYDDYHVIETFFGDDSEHFTDPLDIKLCNNAGKKAVNKLTEFICGISFSPCGSWITPQPLDRSDINNLLLTHELKEALTEKFLLSNFYHENAKTICSAFKWGRGFMDVRYNKGVSFLSYDTDKLVLSTEKGNNQRAYFKSEMTAREIRADYASSVDMKLGSDPNKIHEVLIAVIPNTDEWFASRQPSKNKWVEVKILMESRQQLQLKEETEDMVGFKGYPYLEYRPHTTDSLCREAVKDAAFLNYYCIMERNRIELVVHPPFQGPYTNYLDGPLSFAPQDYFPNHANEKDIKPIGVLTEGDKVLTDIIIRLTQTIRETFRIDDIKQIEAFVGSQAEYHRLLAAFYKSLFPLISGLTTVYMLNTLERVHAMCLSHDEEYAQKFKDLEVKFLTSGFTKKIADAEKMSGIGMLGQALAPYAESKPEVLDLINFERVGLEAVKTLNLHEVLKTPAEYKAEVDEKSKMMAQDQQKQDIQDASNVALTQAQAQQAAAKGE